MDSRKITVMTGLGLAFLAGGLWLLISTGSEPPSPLVDSAPSADSPAADASTIAQLRQTLDQERDRSAELSAEVDWLRYQLGVLADLAAADGAEQDNSEPSAELDPNGLPIANPNDALMFDRDALVEGGVPLNEIERLQEFFDASEMAYLELMHQARRDGTYGKRAFNVALRDLRIGLRNEIGDEDFDLLLFATGRGNRVGVADLIGGSPAASWGLKKGDVIVRYGDRRVFKPRELQGQTIQGQRGERITLDVVRGTERVRLYGVRGPLGVKLKQVRRLPESGW